MASDSILVAYDGSEGAKAAIAGAARLFPGRDAIVITIGRSVAGVAPAGVIGMPAGVAGEAMARLDEEVTRQVEALAGEGAEAATAAGLAARAVGRVVTGSAWPEILTLADEHDVAAVAVGSRGLSGVRSMVLGSVSSAVVQHCERPVLVVPG